ncbi:hypothetical protein AZE42_10834, partial [Rhizopogon vesiculosus]
MVLDWDITLSNETIVMVWISSEDAVAVAERGFRIIQVPSDYFYLDCGAGESLGDYPTDTISLAGEQMLWSEQSGPENLDPIVWPRAASSAEIFWSAVYGPTTTLDFR